MSKPASAKSKTQLRLRVTAAAETMLRGGHPWVFGDSVREQNRDGAAGELAVIFDRKDRFLAIGFYDPDSPIRVRVLHAGKPQPINRDWFAARLDASVNRREGLFDERTTGYRLINGESDGWPGLVLDRYNTTLVMKIYTSAWLARLEEIAELIRERLKPGRLVLRLSRNVQASSRKRFDGEILFGEENPTERTATFLENGLRFEADVVRGQKTGFFLDQRENRKRVESLAKGRTVLNAFSFSGGFSVYAARGGAMAVTDLDISQHALAAAKRNFKLNEADGNVSACSRELVQADAFEWLQGNAKRKFGLIVLDPPSLAKRESERAAAIHAYGRLVSLALNHLEADGILAACSCSAHVSAEEFFKAVRSSISRLRRAFSELETSGHAADHPATFREAQYLKAIFLRVS